MNSRDASRFGDLAAEHYISHYPAVGQEHAGGTGFRAHGSDAMPDLALTVEHVPVGGDRVCGRFTHTGRNTGNFVDTPSSGPSVTMPSIGIRRVEDGLFVEHRDELNLVQQIGAVSVTVWPQREARP